jgi:hypothetical protein
MEIIINIKGEIKLEITEQKSNNCGTKIVPLLPFIAKRNTFQTILWKEGNRK